LQNHFATAPLVWCTQHGWSLATELASKRPISAGGQVLYKNWNGFQLLIL